MFSLHLVPAQNGQMVVGFPCCCSLWWGALNKSIASDWGACYGDNFPATYRKWVDLYHNDILRIITSLMPRILLIWLFFFFLNAGVRDWQSCSPHWKRCRKEPVALSFRCCFVALIFMCRVILPARILLTAWGLHACLWVFPFLLVSWSVGCSTETAG